MKLLNTKEEHWNGQAYRYLASQKRDLCTILFLTEFDDLEGSISSAGGTGQSAAGRFC
ncbi:MAG: hypothetical protein ACLT8I_16390 [Blautia faecis]